MEDAALVAALRSALTDMPMFNLVPTRERYGLSPLQYAETPAANPGFDDRLIATHLDWLENNQEDDGGWPLTFDSVGPAARLEWRGRLAVQNLTTLAAWGRL